MKATWKGQVLAESDDTVVVEGNHYFPAASLKRERFRESATHTVCPWKGTASYYDVVVGRRREPRRRLVPTRRRSRPPRTSPAASHSGRACR